MKLQGQLQQKLQDQVPMKLQAQLQKVPQSCLLKKLRGRLQNKPQDHLRQKLRGQVQQKSQKQLRHPRMAETLLQVTLASVHAMPLGQFVGDRPTDGYLCHGAGTAGLTRYAILLSLSVYHLGGLQWGSTMGVYNMGLQWGSTIKP